MKFVSILVNRVFLSLTTIPDARATCAITAVTITTAGLTAAATGFIDPLKDFQPPQCPSLSSPATALPWIKPLTAFFFPSLAEELLWRGMLLPHPSMVPTSAAIGRPTVSVWVQAVIVLTTHVATHPIAGRTVWPRGRKAFEDSRFLCLAFIVLGGATMSYLASGGSVWAAAFTHGLSVALWRDFFGGEAMLSELLKEKTDQSNSTS